MIAMVGGVAPARETVAINTMKSNSKTARRKEKTIKRKNSILNLPLLSPPLRKTYGFTSFPFRMHAWRTHLLFTRIIVLYKNFSVV